MVNTTKFERTCKFCGRTRTVTCTSDNGVDYMGHARGSSSTWDDDVGCDCELGKLVFRKITIKSMCLNCKYYKSGCCTNKKELSEVIEMLNCGDRLHIKAPIKKCKYHELNSDS